MGDAQEMCGCGKPDVTVFETCLRCGNAVSFEELRQQAVDIYDKDNQPIEDAGLPRRHSLMKDPKCCLRLLHLDDRTSHVLSGRFESDWIQHVRPYEAISYTWGGEEGYYTKTEFIIIDGKLFPITKNCAAVLLKIRKPRDSRAIWIDSLCINQNDVNERSVQVSQMGQIFSGAQKVHIYIGDNIDDITASTAFKVLGSIWNVSDFNKRLGVRDDEKQAVRILFSQTYFSRMWIIQEVLLAKTAELHWGTATISWQMFNKDHLKVLGDGIGNYVPEWMKIRANTKNFRNSETLGALLFSAMGSTASNSRDKVYGIYGLLLDAEEEGLTVDYSLSVARVFTNMAAHLIEKHSAFRAVLRHVNHNALIDGEQLPSWVPDFRSRFVSQDISISHSKFKELQISSGITSKESISRGGADELRLRGHILTIPNLKRYSPAKYLNTFVDDSELWEVQANFQADFDPQGHIVFWMPNGMILQLRRHPIKEDAYIFLGECALKYSGTSLPRPVQFHTGRFMDTVFGLERQDLKSLWDLCTTLDRVSHQYRIEFGLEDLNLPDTSMGWERAEHLLNVHGHVGISDGGRKPPGAQQILHFLRFCQSAHTWEVLRESNIALTFHAQYSIQDISDLCLSWLQYRETAEHIIRTFSIRKFSIGKFSIINRRDRVMRRSLRWQFMDHLHDWANNTRTLLNALKWADPFGPPPRFYVLGHDQVRIHGNAIQGAEWTPWPLRNRRSFDTWDHDEHDKIEGKFYIEEMEFVWDIMHDVDHRFDLAVAAPRLRDDLVDYVLEPWDKEWTGMIQAIPGLLAISEQLKSIHSSWSKEKYLGHHALRGYDLKIWPAETITVS